MPEQRAASPDERTASPEERKEASGSATNSRIPAEILKFWNEEHKWRQLGYNSEYSQHQAVMNMLTFSR